MLLLWLLACGPHYDDYAAEARAAALSDDWEVSRAAWVQALESTASPTRRTQAYYELAQLDLRAGDLDGAVGKLKAAITISEKELSAGHLDAGRDLVLLATVYEKQGREGLSEAALTRGVDLRKQNLGATHPEMWETYLLLGRFYLDRGRYVQAETQLLAASSVQDAEAIRGSDEWVMVYLDLSMATRGSGRYEEAGRYLSKAASVAGELPEAHALRVSVLAHRAELARLTGNLNVAIGLLRDAALRGEQSLGPNDPGLATVLHNLGAVQLEAGEADAAVVALTRALAIRVAALGEEHPAVKETRLGLEVARGAQN